MYVLCVCVSDTLILIQMKCLKRSFRLIRHRVFVPIKDILNIHCCNRPIDGGIGIFVLEINPPVVYMKSYCIVWLLCYLSPLASDHNLR